MASPAWDAAAWRAATVALLALALAGLGWWAASRPVPVPAPRHDLWGHLADLRRRLALALVAFLAGTLFVFSFRLELRDGIPLPIPAVHDNMAAQAYRAMSAHLVPEGVQLVVLRPLEGFAAEFTLSLALGFAIALPVVLDQVRAFVGPALRPREARALRLAILPAMALFVAGAAAAYLWIVPALLRTLYGYSEALGAAPYLVVGELVKFTVALMLLFGLACQTPVVMYGLTRAGLVQPRGYLRVWRHAVVAIVFICALTTDGTLVTLAMVALPLVALYFVGIGASLLAATSTQS